MDRSGLFQEEDRHPIQPQLEMYCLCLFYLSCSVGVFFSFGSLLAFVQNEKSMQTLSFALFKI